MDNNHSQSSIGAGALILKDQSVLLVQLNYGKYKGSWILPGGMVETGEHPEQTAIREVKEETGASIHISGLIGIRHRINKDLRANIYYIYLGQLTEDITQSELSWPEEELQQAKFWSINEALKDTGIRPLTREYIKLYLNNPQGAFTKRILPSEHHLNDELFSV
ncbi:MAG: hypothetical protein CL677_02685 [Bdellovibrionaceae bacterium]|mgnify:CR=1 FL=1|nr:hypothetical protein [Pseudobdellovibrionaceae bacterium]|tara:strand:+ start:54635 stop:55126 length:492 start_codon:yes stop_codon:yes gene_type:complete